MKQYLLCICITILLVEIGYTQNTGLIVNSVYGESLYMNRDSTMILSYTKLYSNTKLKKDSIRLVKDIEAYLPDVSIHKKDQKKYTYYAASIDEISYNRYTSPDKVVFENYLTQRNKPGKEWKKVIFSDVQTLEQQTVTIPNNLPCIKPVEDGYKIIFSKVLLNADILIVLRKHITENKVQLIEYEGLDCAFEKKQDAVDMQNMRYAMTKDMLIFHYVPADFFSLYYHWKK